ncbi:MAG: ROK family protein [Chloroflexi bacterium]|nr:ROK family protein [Chloroflexota bacterium]
MNTKLAGEHRPTAIAGPAVRRRFGGAVGVHTGGTVCRAAAGLAPEGIWRSALPAGGVEATCEAMVAAVVRVEPAPKLVVVATPGHVDPASGDVAGAANLGPEWTGTVPLRRLLESRLGCEVTVRNDATVALEAERRRGGLIAANDGALISLSTGVGVARLVGGRETPTELGHSVLQFDGPPCLGRPHRGCFESFLGGWALPLRYKERHPDFTGTAAREIPDDPAFWTECGARLGELVVTLCLLGQRLEVVSLMGQVTLARAHFLLPAVRARVQQEAALLGVVPRRIVVTPLGDDVGVLGALLVARDLLYPFQAA